MAERRRPLGDSARTTLSEPASLVVRPRTFSPGRVLRSMDAGPERTYKLTRLIQRGADFERVAFDES